VANFGSDPISFDNLIGSSTRPPFAHPMGIHEMRDSLPFGRGRHHFFARRSFKAALSSMPSAKSRFNRVFSCFTGVQESRAGLKLGTARFPTSSCRNPSWAAKPPLHLSDLARLRWF
jgi:hypothetical protein